MASSGFARRQQRMHGREFMHTRVEGSIEDLPKIAHKYTCEHCIIAMPSANHLARRYAVDVANSIQMEVLTLPRYERFDERKN